MTEVVSLLLALGFATRFGSQKLLQSLGSDGCIAEQACFNLIKGIDQVVAVVRPDQQELTDLLRVQSAEFVLFLEPVFERGATLVEGKKNALLNCSE
jgi:CTP:molybdopterin cytidylyltransferase MocA